MKTFLLTWELGSGLGHLHRLRPFAEGLTARGHRVVVALRDLSRAGEVFRDKDIALLQAPFKHRRTNQIEPAVSFAHLLHNIGFGDLNELSGLAEAWRNLIRYIRPDAILFDHSPTALLAVRGLPAKRVLLGTGFICPPNESPLPRLRVSEQHDSTRLVENERAVLDVINRLLNTWRERPLDRVADLYHPADEQLLMTFPELDHYPTRTGGHYWGACPSHAGKPAHWPTGIGKKIYAYLKPFPALPHLFDQICRSGCPTIIYCDGVSEQTQSNFNSPNLRFENQPLDLLQIGRECDVAILNATHGTATAMLLAGKPSLHIPLFPEQAMLAEAVVRLGAGLVALPTDPSRVVAQFQLLLADDRLARPARSFADKYAAFDQNRQIAIILDRLEQLVRDGENDGPVRTSSPRLAHRGSSSNSGMNYAARTIATVAVAESEQQRVLYHGTESV